MTVRTGISNGLHLVHVKVVNDGIKTGVEVVQQIHHLEGGAAPSNLCEPNNVTAWERGERREERGWRWREKRGEGEESQEKSHDRGTQNF